MSTPIKLIVGLGNPGSKYARTRHNVGFWAVDELVDGAGWRTDRKFNCELGKASLGGQACWLMKPTTFMNRSGEAVAPFARFNNIEPAQILVIHDDLDLEAGSVRLKAGGGHGGHNGLRDLIARLGSAEFLRLRLGIGHPRGRVDDEVIDYVLKTPSPDDLAALRNAQKSALSRIGDIVGGQAEKVMNELNRRQSTANG